MGIRQAIEEWSERAKTLRRMGFKEGVRTVADLSRIEALKFLYRHNANLAKRFYLPIRHLQLEITTKCNLRCITCDQAYRNIRGENLTLNNFKTILNKLPNLTHLAPQGLGEPLLHPDLFSMLEMAESRAIKSCINSNFMIFSEERAKKLAMLADRLIFSLSGASKETFESIHAGASFEKVTGNIRRFMQIKEGLGQRTAKVEAKFIIINKNVQEMPQLVTLADDLGIKTIWFDDLIPFNEISDLKVEEERVAEEVSSVKKIAKEKGIRLIIDLRKEPSTISKCPWPFSGIFVSVDGEVYPCCNLPVFRGSEGHREEFTFGNILTDDINAIWRGERFEALRRKIAQNKVPKICEKANCFYVQKIDKKEGSDN